MGRAAESRRALAERQLRGELPPIIPPTERMNEALQLLGIVAKNQMKLGDDAQLRLVQLVGTMPAPPVALAWKGALKRLRDS